MCDQNNIDSQSSLVNQKSYGKRRICTEKKKNRSSLKNCSQCSMTFQFQRHYDKHMEGHDRNNCQHCSGLFTKRKELIVHMETEHGIKIPEADYRCKFCNKSFGKKIILFKHYKEHANGQWVCIHCGKFLQTESALQSHQEKHKANKKWSCVKCKECFTRRQQYLLHMKDHEKYRCQDCGESFASKIKFRGHRQGVHNIRSVERKHQCSECGQRFPRPRLLTMHFRIHTGEKPHECKECGKRYHTQRGYAWHLLSSAHQNPDAHKKSKCPDCELEFGSKHLLDRHILRTHKQEMLYKCEYCDQSFNCKENMKRHFALHTEERQFVCEHCAAAFHSMNALKDHISYVHSLVREFVCAKCGMSFKRNSGLNRHMASHSEDRPFVCRCGVSYKRSSHLRRHKESVHGEILKSQKLIRLKQDETGTFVPAEDSVKESRRKKKLVEQGNESLEEEKDGKDQVVRTFVISVPEVQLSSTIPPPLPVIPLSLSTSSSVSSISTLTPSLGVTSAQPSILQEPSTAFVCKGKLKTVPLGNTGEHELPELCVRDLINNSSLECEELVTVTDTSEICEADESRTSSFTGNTLHTIVSYDPNDFSTTAAPMPSEPQLVLTSSVPVSSINIDRSHQVLTLTFDPLLESNGTFKLSDEFSQEKCGDPEAESSLLLNSSSHLTLDSISDPLYIPTVAMDRVSSLITTTDTVLTSSAVPLASDDASLGCTLVSSSDSSTMGSSSALFNSVDSTFGTLQHSEVLLSMHSHVDTQSSVSPYSLSHNLNINVSDCESLLTAQNNDSQNSSSMILTQETEETIGLDSGGTITVLPDYLHPNFSFLNV